MLTIAQYKILYPNENMFCGMSGLYPGIREICEGMLQFTEDSAACWGGPFDGNFAYFSMQDYTKATMPYGKNKGENLLAVWEKARVEKEKEYKEQVERGAHKYKHISPPSDYLESASIDRPIRLYMAGNDDTSYSKFYTSEDEAQEELNLFIGNQPLDFHDVVQDFDFVFTN
jgi:hypothetical protein